MAKLANRVSDATLVSGGGQPNQTTLLTGIINQTSTTLVDLQHVAKRLDGLHMELFGSFILKNEDATQGAAPPIDGQLFVLLDQVEQTTGISVDLARLVDAFRDKL